MSNTNTTPAASHRCVCGYNLEVMPCPYHGYDRPATAPAPAVGK
jgi:hypothetical protein